MDQKTPLTKIQKSVSLYAREEKSSYMDHIGYALYAFGGLGIELLLILLETKIYAIPSESWNTGQNILHWVITCSLWGGIGYLLAQKLPPPIQRKPLSALEIFLLLFFASISVGITTVMWGGFKPAAEFTSMGHIDFLIQYVYYAAEAFLLFLILAHGQHGAELLLKKQTVIPYGGILLALTWGLVHVFTQGLFTGAYTFFQALLYGCAFSAAKKNYLFSYLAILFMFML